MSAYAARNAILPNITGFAISLGFVVGGVDRSPRTSSPIRASAGRCSRRSENKDYPLMQGIFLVITLAVLAANFLADLLYVLLDPRTRQEA